MKLPLPRRQHKTSAYLVSLLREESFLLEKRCCLIDLVVGIKTITIHEHNNKQTYPTIHLHQNSSSPNLPSLGSRGHSHPLIYSPISSQWTSSQLFGRTLTWAQVLLLSTSFWSKRLSWSIFGVISHKEEERFHYYCYYYIPKSLFSSKRNSIWKRLALELETNQTSSPWKPSVCLNHRQFFFLLLHTLIAISANESHHQLLCPGEKSTTKRWRPYAISYCLSSIPRRTDHTTFGCLSYHKIIQQQKWAKGGWQEQADCGLPVATRIGCWKE